nr:hypothetical protein [Rubrimonas cliftonensis]
MIAVVGPSGVGKDSVIAGLVAARPDLHRVRRVITRPEGAGGEPFDAVTPERFAQLRDTGRLALWWEAHGYCYGLPARMAAVLQAGGDAVANLSRAALPEAAARFRPLVVLALDADPARLAERLAGRGREDAAAIAGRLSRRAPPPVLAPALAQADAVIALSNDGALGETVAAALAALFPETAGAA